MGAVAPSGPGRSGLPRRPATLDSAPMRTSPEPARKESEPVLPEDWLLAALDQSVAPGVVVSDGLPDPVIEFSQGQQ
jgi:hypothetical protein